LDAYLAPIPPSHNVDDDFRHWQHDRLMADYDAVKPWCELILRERLPMTVVGQWEGLSLLFPMEKLFERYVADCLKQKIARSATVVTQAASKHLVNITSVTGLNYTPTFL
jgi:5-methylcytosine-specific restriction enzyme subunit McrC